MFYSFAFVSCVIITGCIAVKWTDLRVTYSPEPSSGFHQIPRQQSDATDWVSVSNDDCTNSGKFNGYRYVPTEYAGNNDYPIVVLFDKQGSIAGLQIRLPWSAILNTGNKLNLGATPEYQNDTDVNYMVLTAYFENPDNICKDSGTKCQEETCEGLWLQNGISPSSTIQAPKLRANAIQQGWTKNTCYPGMGVHNYYQVDTWDKSNCSEIRPFALLYNHADELQGFIYFLAAKAMNKYFENPPYDVIKLIVAPNTPACVKKQTENGVISMHVYFLDKPWEFKCN